MTEVTDEITDEINEDYVKALFMKRFPPEYLDLIEERGVSDIREFAWMCFIHGYSAGIKEIDE